MKLNRIFLLLSAVTALLNPLSATAQELNCTVEVNAQQVSGTNNSSVFNTLRDAISDYMNNTKFSNAQFSPIEKIDCKLFLTVKDYTDNTVTGDLQIQSSRPVYNSSYTTTLINFKDSKIDFTYQEGDPLQFSEMTMESQLTAILNFYAYLILAVDFDSFSPRGGDPFFERLEQIVQLAQSSGETGWRAFEDNKNRSAVLAAYTDPSTSQLRDLTYNYHLQGLDQMSLSPDKGRAKITESLSTLKNVYNVSPMSVGLSMFRDAKLDELVNLYTKGTQDERDRVVEILSSLYPTDSDRIRQIKEGKNN